MGATVRGLDPSADEASQAEGALAKNSGLPHAFLSRSSFTWHFLIECLKSSSPAGTKVSLRQGLHDNMSEVFS